MTPESIWDRARTGIIDPLDAQLQQSVSTSVPAVERWPPGRFRLGWSATSFPVAALLLFGIVLGPQGVSLLSPAVLSFLDPILPVALAALGVLAGFGIGRLQRWDRRPLVAGTCQSAFTMLVVVAGVFLAASAVNATAPPVWSIALAAGVSAATSSSPPTWALTESRTVPGPLDFDVALPIIIGGLVLASVREGLTLGAMILAAQACVVALAITAAGWLLLRRSSSETEQRVIAIATLLLLGGAADYLSLSALLGGFIAGFSWQVAGGEALMHIRRDVLYLQHPLLVLVLLTAGARVDFSIGSLVLAAAYVLLRTVGKLGGGLICRRINPESFPHTLRFDLLSPGMFGVAFALNAVRAAGPDAQLILTVAVVGTIGTELIGTLVERGERVQ